MSRRLVILQPFYLPYIGVFELARLCDIWVVYDDVQLVKSSWQTRNRILTKTGPKWITVPVRASFGDNLVNASIDNRSPWRRKHWRSMEHAYGDRQGFGILERVILPSLEQEVDSLVELNTTLFEAVIRFLGLRRQLLRSSELGVGGSSSQRVLEICLALGATHYLSGASAKAYLDEASFEQAGVSLEYLDFIHPVYSQEDEAFTPYLSIVDVIANVGEGTRDLIAGSGRPVPVARYTP